MSIFGAVFTISEAILFFSALLSSSMRVRAVVSEGDPFVERLARVDMRGNIRERRRNIAEVLRGVDSAIVTYAPSPIRRVLGKGRTA